MPDQTEHTLLDLRLEYEALPYGPVRAAANRAAVLEADQVGLSYFRIHMRADLAWALAMGDDPVTALPVCAEFFSLLEEFPDTISSDDNNIIIGIANVATYVAQSLPQIPLDQCWALLEQFRERVQRYGMGKRVWQLSACYLCMETGNVERAREHYEAFCTFPRDGYSDCPACETSNAAEFLLRDGRRKQAEELIRPVLEGNLVCADQPHGILSMLIDDDLGCGNLPEAVEKAQRLARIACRDRSDLAHIGAILRCRAYTEPGQSVGLLEKSLRWSIGMWDQRLLFQFYLGAWIFCLKLGEAEESVRLHLPKKFPLYREDGQYLCQELAKWFYEQAANIGTLFDTRNGSDCYTGKLEIAQLSLAKI